MMQEKTGLLATQVECLVDAIMTVDVEQGCRRGRINFVREHLGDEWASYAESHGRHVEVYVFVVETSSDDAYNAIDYSCIEQFITEQAENGDCDAEVGVRSDRWDVKPEIMAGDLLTGVGDILSTRGWRT